jgi:hypothetical protein
MTGDSVVTKCHHQAALLPGKQHWCGGGEKLHITLVLSGKKTLIEEEHVYIKNTLY